MIRCPACGRRLRDAAPVCATHGAPPAAPEQVDETTPFVVPTPDLPVFRVRRTLGQGGFGAVFLAERISDGQPVAIKVARADNIAAGESLMREAQALSAVGPPHVPAVYERGVLDDGSVVRGDGVRAGAAPGRAVDGAAGTDAARRVRARRAGDLDRRRDGARARLRPLRSQAGEPVRRRGSGVKLFDFGLVRSVAWRSDRRRVDHGGSARRHARLHVARAVRGARRRSTRAATSTRWARSSTRCCSGAPPFWGNSAEVQQSHRSRRPPALSRRARDVPRARGRRSCAAWRRIPTAASPTHRGLPAGAAGAIAAGDAARVPRSAPAVCVRRRRRRDAKGAAEAGCAGARAARGGAGLLRDARATSAAVREAMTNVGAQLAHTAGAQVVLAFGHEVGDNPTRAGAERRAADGRARSQPARAGRPGHGVDPGAPRRHAPLSEPALRQERPVPG